jgi:hypothetical protein
MKKSNLSQKEILMKSILKSNKIDNIKKISNTKGKLNTKGNVNIREKNRKSQ